MHGGVVNNAKWFAQSFLEIESPPARAEMFRLAYDATILDRRGKSDRDRVELPIAKQRFHLQQHVARRQVRAGFEFALLLARNHQLHVRAADVDHENLFLHAGLMILDGGAGASICATVMGTSLSARIFFLEPLIFFTRSRETSRKCHCACIRGS